MARPAQTRDALLVELEGVFRERGYEGATLVQLAAATGLGKASLYHHFPGGKAEMVGVLIRHAVNDLQQSVFRHLDSHRPPDVRVIDMIEGFERYVADGESNCLLAVLAQGSARAELGAGVHAQFETWLSKLEQTLIEAGMKPKRAARTARQIMTNVYGSLVLARLLDDTGAFKQSMKRLRKDVTGLALQPA